MGAATEQKLRPAACRRRQKGGIAIGLLAKLYKFAERRFTDPPPRTAPERPPAEENRRNRRRIRIALSSPLPLVAGERETLEASRVSKCARFCGRLPLPKASKTLCGKLFPPEPLFRCAKSTFLCVFLAIVVCLQLVRCISTTVHKHLHDTMCH